MTPAKSAAADRESRRQTLIYSPKCNAKSFQQCST